METGKIPVPTAVNRMINDLVHRTNGAKDILDGNGLPALLDHYGLSAREKAAFDEPSPPSFGAIGVLPVHIILLMIEINADIREHLSIGCHMERFRSEVLKG